MRFIRVAAIVLTVCVGVALAQDSSTPAGGVTDEAFDAALAKAASAEPGSADFVAALQSVAPRFSAIEPATQPASGAWHNVPLNTRGKKVDAFRFRVPEGERRDLFWALAFSPKSMGRWYIAPAEGPVGKGFSSFLKASPAKLFKGTPPEGFVGIVQSLSSEHLEPGREYLIWFVFKDEQPATISVAMALIPSKGKPSDNGAYKALGLPLAPAEKPVEPAQ
jgi:hypothetical protein